MGLFKFKHTGSGHLIVKFLKIPICRFWDRQAIKIISESDVFDADYYASLIGGDLHGVSPAEHYLRYGVQRGINPSRNFSARDFEIMTGVTIGKKNPVLYYEGRKGSLRGNVFTEEERKRQRIASADVEALQSIVGRKVLIISHEMSRTGAPVVAVDTAVRFKAKGWIPIVISPYDGPMVEECRRREIYARVCYQIQLKRNTLPPEEYNQLRAFIDCFDLVIFNTLVSAPWIHLACNTRPRKVLWSHEGYDAWKQDAIREAALASLPLYDDVFAGGDYAKSFIERHCKGNVRPSTLLYAVADQATRTVSSRAHDRVRLIFAGTITKRKGVDVIRDAIRQMPLELQTRYEVHIIGKASDNDLYKSLLSFRDENVILEGEMPLSDLLERINQSDILICPSRDDPMPMVATFALMFAKPVIVSDQTGTAELIKGHACGYVVRAGDATELMRAMVDAIKNSDGLEVMGKKARQVYEENFSVDSFDRHLERVIHGRG